MQVSVLFGFLVVVGCFTLFCRAQWADRTHFVLKQRLATNSSVIDSFTLSR